jgi:hypothetical protein
VAHQEQLTLLRMSRSRRVCEPLLQLRLHLGLRSLWLRYAIEFRDTRSSPAIAGHANTPLTIAMQATT